MFNELNAFVNSALLVGLLSSVSNGNTCRKSKTTLMNWVLYLLVGGVGSKNAGLPKGRETHGDGVPIVVKKKRSGTVSRKI